MKLKKPIIRFTCMTGMAALLLITGLLAACRGSTHAKSYLGTSQTLPATKATLAGNDLNLWLARTYQEKASGLMFFDAIANDQGMLFIYDEPRIMSFWMKNTRIPLDLVFFNENLEINGWIKDMQPGYGLPERSLPSYASDLPAQYALELNTGSIDRLKLKPGDRLEIPITLLYSD